jgi:ankyrin repeat protein
MTLVVEQGSAKGSKQTSILSRFTDSFRQRKTVQKETRPRQLYSDLCDAASTGNLPVVQDLIARGANTIDTYATHDKRSMKPEMDPLLPMELAILGGHADVIRYLSENGIELHEDKLQALLLNLNSPNPNRWITKILSKSLGPFDEADLVAPYSSRRKPRNIRSERRSLWDKEYTTVGHILAWKSNARSLEILQNWLAKGRQVSIDLQIHGGPTLLHCASIGTPEDGGSRLDVIKLFLDKGASPNVTAAIYLDDDECNDKKDAIVYRHAALRMARDRKREAIVHRRTALQMACERGLEAVVALLVSHCGASVIMAQDTFGYGAVHYAAGMGNSAILRTVLESSPDMHMRSNGGTTPLHYTYSAPGDSVANVKAIYDRLPTPRRNADSNVLEKPIHYAAAEGNTKVVEYLLSNGSDANVQSFTGITPLILAAAGGHESTISSLVSGGAKLETATAAGPALFYACRVGELEAVRTLLECGASVQTTNSWGVKAAELVAWLKDDRESSGNTANAITALLFSRGGERFTQSLEDKNRIHDFVRKGRKVKWDLICLRRRFGNRKYIDSFIVDQID